MILAINFQAIEVGTSWMLDFWSDESSTDSESEEDQGGVLEPVSQSEAEVIESNQRLHRVRETHLYQRRLRELQGFENTLEK